MYVCMYVCMYAYEKRCQKAAEKLLVGKGHRVRQTTTAPPWSAALMTTSLRLLRLLIA